MTNRYLRILLVSCAAIFFASAAFGLEDKDIAEQIKELEKKIQRAADVEAIKLLMTAMQHTFGLDAGVKKTSGQCFGQADGYMYGAFVRRSEKIEKAQAPDSAGKSAPHALVTLDKLDFHMLTTSVIEIAEDGQTAKAVWYTPGMVGSTWMYENYACDFVKEDGEWKSWHRTVYADFSTVSNKAWTDNTGEGRGGAPMGGAGAGPSSSPPGGGNQPPGGAPQMGSAGGGPTPSQANVNPLPGGTGKDLSMVAYEGWTVNTKPQYNPKPPVPYRTFSETFSYCPEMPKELEEQLLREGMMY